VRNLAIEMLKVITDRRTLTIMWRQTPTQAWFSEF